MLLKKYPELYWLTNDVNATPEGKSSNNTDSISKFYSGRSILNLTEQWRVYNVLNMF